MVGDYAAHLRYGRTFAETLEPPIGHFLFAALAGLLGELIGSYDAAAVVIVTAAQALTVVVAAAWISQQVVRTPREARVASWARASWPSVAAAVAVVLIGPASVLLAHDLTGHFFGYIAVSTYHNPTQLLLRPFALLVFIAVVPMVEARPGRSASGPVIGATAAFVVLATFAKPSYTICIVPAAVVAAALRRWRGKAVDQRGLLLGLFLPAVVALALTYVVTFVTGVEGFESTSGGIVFAPFDTYSFFSGQLLLKLLLSIAFPLSVLVAYPRAWSRDGALRLAWIAFGFGAAATYLLAEEGARFYHGNFWWSGQVTLFVLCVASIAHALRAEASSTDEDGRWKPTAATAVCALTLVLQVISGLEFLTAAILEPSVLLS